MYIEMYNQSKYSRKNSIFYFQQQLFFGGIPLRIELVLVLDWNFQRWLVLMRNIYDKNFQLYIPYSTGLTA